MQGHDIWSVHETFAGVRLIFHQIQLDVYKRQVYEKGGIFDAWTEFFDNNRWVEAFAECGIDTDFYTMRERPLDEIFPWDFIDDGVSKKFLIREWERARKEEVTPNCRMQCQGCGAAQFKGGVCFENKN